MGLILGLKSLICRFNYFKKILQLKNIYSKRKIRVLFYVTENSKWRYQSLYEELARDEHFEPFVCVSVLTSVHKGEDKTRYNIEENYNFFKTRDMQVVISYKDGKYIDFSKFHPDIVFYEQPYDLPSLYKPYRVSRYALACYCDYGLQLVDDDNNYTQNFHRLLWKFFVDSPLNIPRYESYRKGNSKNCFVKGYVKFDAYLDYKDIDIKKVWKEPDKIKIIYAPHHSFEFDGLRFATFQWSGKEILEFAKNNPNTTWVFKPHPRFKFALLKNRIMSEEEIENYYNEWEKVGKICSDSNYFDFFNTSDLMITDSCSFLGEYLLTKKPLFRLLNSDSMSLNDFGKKLSGAIYESYNFEEFKKLYEDVIINKNDYKYEKRLETLKYLIDFKEKSANKICEELKKDIKKGEK